MTKKNKNVQKMKIKTEKYISKKSTKNENVFKEKIKKDKKSKKMTKNQKTNK